MSRISISMVDAMNPGAVAFALNMARNDAAKPVAAMSGEREKQ
jgi:hypothetical protein